MNTDIIRIHSHEKKFSTGVFIVSKYNSSQIEMEIDLLFNLSLCKNKETHTQYYNNNCDYNSNSNSRRRKN